jgi:hypothetical protein
VTDAAILGAIIGEVADEVPPEALALFHQFDRRTDRERSLEAFNLHVQGENESFRYC